MTGTYMQRVFDALRDASEKLTLSEIALRTGIERGAVRDAVRRLGELKLTSSVCPDGKWGVWRYGLKENAQRPADGRGRMIRVAGEAS